MMANGFIPAGLIFISTKFRPRIFSRIRAYLATLPPVHNEIQSDQLSFPFSIRAGMIGWDLLDDSDDFLNMVRRH
jgi:hypothetical protein